MLGHIWFLTQNFELRTVAHAYVSFGLHVFEISVQSSHKKNARMNVRVAFQIVCRFYSSYLQNVYGEGPFFQFAIP